MRLFVYGTLRRGEQAHHLLGAATLVAELHTEPRYTLVLLDGYPALVDGGDTAVRGELYEIEDALIAQLDDFEDAPELYQREQRDVGGAPAWLYVLRPEHAAGRPVIENGDWKRR